MKPEIDAAIAARSTGMGGEILVGLKRHGDTNSKTILGGSTGRRR